MTSQNQIIQSLCDTDLYKFTMMQVAFHQFPNAVVEYRFRCRTKGINLIPYISEIKEEIEAFCGLRMTKPDLENLSSIYFMKPDFIDFLEIYRPRFKHVDVVPVDPALGTIDIVVKGPWWATILFEVPCLSIVNEVYFRNTYNMNQRMEEGERILLEKIQDAEQDPLWKSFKFSEFGTRRRMSRQWHERVLTILKERAPEQLQSSSNVELSRKFGIGVMGTMAHEYLQAFQALGPRLRDSQTAALDAWVKEYQGSLGIALTDVIGMRAFLRDFNLYYAKLYDGLRHDSGDPFEWADAALDHYASLRINSQDKTLVFSDRLTFGKSMDLMRHVNGRARTSFGIGTYLTNDTGVPALDVVMKMVNCNGAPVAKLSDSPGKTMCLDQKYVEYLASVFA